MNKNALRIGIFGTFDVENYGDLLFPLIAEAELSKRFNSFTLHRFSYSAKSLPGWPYEVTSLTELPGRVKELDGILVGGGDIIRFDQEVAPGYKPPNDSIHHPTGYWLLPMLLALKHNIPLAWNAPGVWKGVPSGAEALMKLIIEGSDYVSIRDEGSRQRLHSFCADADIRVVPDTAWGLSSLVENKTCAGAFCDLRKTYDLVNSYIIVQATTRLKDVVSYISKNQRLFRNYQLVVLPIGTVFGENSQVFDEIDADIVRLPSDLDPLLIAEIIKHAAAVVAVSLHLSISALAFGVPLFRPASAFDGKYGVLSKFQNVYSFERADRIKPRFFVKAECLTSPPPQIQNVHAQLSRHWDAVAATFLCPPDSGSRKRALTNFHSAMPNFMEGDWLSRYASMMNEFPLIEEAPKEEVVMTPYHRMLRKAKAPLRVAKGWLTRT